MGVDLADDEASAEVARRAVLVVGDGVVLVDGEDVARAIRTPEIDAAAAAVARLPRVREVLIAEQREMGRAGGVVMEGRDIGTVVFPTADVKVYLDATPEERARRRAHDPAHTLSGGAATVGDVATALEARDRSDRTRSTSPLTMAEDAVLLDTTNLSIEQAIEAVLALVGRVDRSANGAAGQRWSGQHVRSCGRSPRLIFMLGIVLGRRRVELPAVAVALGDLVGGLQLLAVLVLHAQAPSRCHRRGPDPGSGCRRPGPRRRSSRRLPSWRRRRRR